MKTVISVLLLCLALNAPEESRCADDQQFPNNWKFTSECQIDSLSFADTLKSRHPISVADAQKKSREYTEKLQKKISESKATTFFVNVPPKGEVRVVVTVSEYPNWKIPNSPSDNRSADVSDAVIEHKELPAIPEQDRFRNEKVKAKKAKLQIAAVTVMLLDMSGKVLDSLSQRGDATDELVKQIVHRTRGFGLSPSKK